MSYHCIRGSGECNGCMECKDEPDEYYCPVCGEQVFETVYISNNNEVIGCENCVSTKEPWEVSEE